MPSLVSVNVALPETLAWRGRTILTGLWKRPVSGRRMVRRLNIDGDGQGDPSAHGGEHRAVLVYQIQSYQYWQRHFARDDLEYGQFGENFTVDGLADDEVCIGDRFRIGEAEFEVTQPRVTCFRAGLRIGEPELASLLVAHRRPGFYMRVIAEGHVQSGDEIVQTRTGPQRMTVAYIDALLYLPDRDVEQLRTAVTIPALSAGWRQSFQELLDVAENDANREAGSEAATASWNGFRRVRVSRTVAESATVTSFHLVADDDQPLPGARAGQHVSVRVHGTPGELAPVRRYSLSSSSDSGVYRISVKREPHGLVSTLMHANVGAGTALDVTAPRGTFVVDNGTNPVLLVSAGVGVTPLLAMLHRLSSQSSPREVWWIHTARSREEHAFATESHQLVQSMPNACEHLFYTNEHANTAWSAAVNQGRLSPAALADLRPPSDATAYICGPPSFMRDTRDALVAAGIDPARIHTEQFGALPAVNPGLIDQVRVRPHLPPQPQGTGPMITFARSGLKVRWSVAYASLLDLADACDVPTRWGCRTGVCHACSTPVLDGDITHEPPPLEPPGPGEVLICCARPTSDVILDL
jgi:ferredoxin-NADP reductase/MOSC domain-containing protein YiiM